MVGSANRDVRRLQALGALGRVELNGRAFAQGAEAATLNRGKVNEHVVTILARDEAEALCVVEPLDVPDGVAERTGVSIDRAGVRGRRGICRSFTELTAKSRRLGDGYYYLASTAWPAEAKSVDLVRAWTSLG